jgi:heme exporter protein CcmD
MGGYAFYVWGSYLFAFVAIVWEVITLSHRKKTLVKEQPEVSAPASAIRGSANETTS